MSLGRGLELSQVLRGIVEAAVTLTDAEYGALGVVDDGRRLSQFLPVGIADELAARIGQVPCGRGILGELIRNPAPLRLTDLSQHPGSYGFPAHHPPMRTFLGVPIRVRDEVFGNLYLTEKRGGRFDAEDEAVLTTLSVAAGMAIENARMYEESRRRERRVEALAEVTRALLTGSEAREVLDLIARRALEVAGADTAAVLIPADGRPDQLVVEVAHGRDAHAISGRTVPARGSLAGLAAATGEPAVSQDIRADERAHPIGGDPREYGSTVAVPLPVDTAAGALRLSRLAGRQAFDPAEVKLISGFADQAAIALELARRRAQSEELAVLHDRDRIARDLHDLAIQRLFATGMTLQSATRLIERPEAVERVGRAVDDLDDTIRIIRSAIFGLRSTGVGTAPGLRHRMTETARAAARALGFAPALRIEGPVDTTVPGELAEHLAAVAAEALSNTARHAGAGRVDVHLAVTDQDVALTVTDDGVGVGDAPHTGGLSNLRIRAELLGGTLTVGSPGSGGTRIVWRVPLP
ncbi:histidine kinase [Streptomyces albus subsp. albus]|nr:histidine kinase [Streptomyces albus subsp. albus]